MFLNANSAEFVCWLHPPDHKWYGVRALLLSIFKVVCKTGARHIVGVCSTFYLECVHGIWRQKQCPAMTAFDVTISQCSYMAAGCEPQHSTRPQYPTTQTASRLVPAPTAPASGSVPPEMAPTFAVPKVTPAPPCEIGGLIPRGECLATFLECVEFDKFLLRHCAQVKNFLVLTSDPTESLLKFSVCFIK